MHKLVDYAFIYLIPLSLSAIFSLKSFRLRWPISFKIFSIFLWLTLMVEALAILWKWYLFNSFNWSYGRSNLWIYNFFLIIRCDFFLAFYFFLIESIIIKKLAVIITVLITIFGLINYFFIQSPHEVDSYTIVAANMLCIGFSVLYFIQILNDNKNSALTHDPVVWISFGAFIYHSGSLPFFIFFEYLLKEHLSFAISYLYINDGLNIAMYTLYLTAFLCKPHFQN